MRCAWVQRLSNKATASVAHPPASSRHGKEEQAMREGGPYIGWFADPAGNVLAVLQER